MIYLLYILLVIPLLIGVTAVRAVLCKKTLPAGKRYDKHSDEDLVYAERLSEMIKFKTIAVDAGGDQLQFDGFKKKLGELFPVFLRRAEEILIDGAYLWKIKGATDGKPALILAHCDVVEADGGWEAPPFDGVIKDGFIHGRGAFDNKGMLCALLSAAEHLLEEGFTPQYDIYIGSTHNEESSSEGIFHCRDYFEQNGIAFRSILDEGGAVTCGMMPGVENDMAMVGLCEKGYMDIRFTFKGSGGHSSSPAKGNPLAQLSAFINYIENKKVFRKRIPPTVREMFRAVAPHMRFPHRLLLCNFWLYSGLLKAVLPGIDPNIGAMMQTTIVFTRCEGSSSNNVIPTTAWAVANIRNLPGESCEEVAAKLSAIAKKFGLEAEVLSEKCASSETSAESDAVAALSGMIGQVFPGTVVTPYMTTGATDCCRLDSLSEQIVRFSPLRVTGEELEAVHGDNERLGIAQLGRGVEFFKLYLSEMTGGRGY